MKQQIVGLTDEIEKLQKNVKFVWIPLDGAKLLNEYRNAESHLTRVRAELEQKEANLLKDLEEQRRKAAIRTLACPTPLAEEHKLQEVIRERTEQALREQIQALQTRVESLTEAMESKNPGPSQSNGFNARPGGLAQERRTSRAAVENSRSVETASRPSAADKRQTCEDVIPSVTGTGDEGHDTVVQASGQPTDENSELAVSRFGLVQRLCVLPLIRHYGGLSSSLRARRWQKVPICATNQWNFLR